MKMKLLTLCLLLINPSFAKSEEPKLTAGAEKILQLWLGAQNSGDFEAYEKLYGDEFRGVRRSGERVVFLNKVDWLKDRQRMFKKKMVVEATEVKETSKTLTFKQRWKSGSYEDVGVKVLRFRLDNEKFKIVSEELMTSSVTPMQIEGCPNPPEKEHSEQDGIAQTVIRNRQIKAGRGCLDIKVESYTENDGEFAKYSWSADLKYFEGGKAVDTAKLSGEALLQSFGPISNGLEIEDSTPAQCFGSGFVFENDTTTLHRARIKDRKIELTSKEKSNVRVFCPPHPEGRTSCEMSCLGAKYEAVKAVCERSETKCQKAISNYEKKHPPCHTDCNE